SLMAVELSQQLTQRLPFTVSPMKLLGGLSTVQLAAQLLSGLESSLAETPQPAALVPQNDDGPVPLAFPQPSSWRAPRRKQGRPFLNVPFWVRLRGRLDVAVLEQCLHNIVQRHETLRTVFSEENGPPQQKVVTYVCPRLPVEDCSQPSPAER